MRTFLDICCFPVRAIDRAAPYARWAIYYAPAHYTLLTLGCWLIMLVAATRA